MNALYYQYGNGPASMQTPNYQTFLQLLEQMRKTNGMSQQPQQGSGVNLQGLAQFANKFFPAASVSNANMAQAAAPGYFDMPAPRPAMGSDVGTIFG